MMPCNLNILDFCLGIMNFVWILKRKSNGGQKNHKGRIKSLEL